MQNSPSYAAAYSKFGANMPHAHAISFAGEHSFTLEDLRREAEMSLHVTNGTVKTLELWQALGY